jgi:hypothetical protein
MQPSPFQQQGSGPKLPSAYGFDFRSDVALDTKGRWGDARRGSPLG